MKADHCIERMELLGSVLLLQGWVLESETLTCPAQLKLAGHHPGGQAWELDVPLNRERSDVCAALGLPVTALQCGFFFYGRIPGGEGLTLWRTGASGDALLHSWAERRDAGSDTRRQGLAHWAYLLRRGWTLLRAGQWRSLSQRVGRHLSTAVSIHRPRLRFQAPAEPQQAVDCLVIDHDLGGGANQYRREKILQRAKEGQSLVLLTFSVLRLRYIAYRMLADGTAQFLRSMAWSEVLPWIDQIRPRQIFYNNAVSFPDVLAIVEGLVAYKAEHRDSCRLVLAVHDYFAICPSQHLINADGEFCNLPSPEACSRCLQRSGQTMVSLYRHHGIAAWRQAWGTLLHAADEVLAFDPSARTLLERAFRPLPPERWVLRPHGVPPLTEQEQALLQRWQKSKKHRSGKIGVVGLIGSDIKGVTKVHELVAAIARNRWPYQVVAIGQVSPRPLDAGHYIETGPYNAKNLARLVVENDIDVFFFSSIGPETYSYVLHEIERFGLPIAAFNLGAQATFLDSYPAGICLEMSDGALEIIVKIKPYLQG